MSTHEIQHLLHLYGLIVVFGAAGLQAVGLPIPGGTALVAAAVYASTKHGLPVIGVIVAGTLGALIGTTVGFAIGRWRGERVLLRLGKLMRRNPERIQHLRAEFQAHATLALFVARFITGARNVAGLVAGASGIELPRFLLISALAATVWSTVITLEYYFIGHTILAAATWLQVLLVIVGIGATILSFKLLRPGMFSTKPPAAPAEAGE